MAAVKERGIAGCKLVCTSPASHLPAAKSALQASKVAT